MSNSDRVVSEDEANDALRELRYHFSESSDGILIYRHTEEPSVSAVMDFSKGPIPYNHLLASLSIQGVNADAMAAYLED